jgi:hypothetical protein
MVLLDPADTQSTKFYSCGDTLKYKGNQVLNLGRDLNTWGFTRLVARLNAIPTVNLIVEHLPEPDAYLATFYEGKSHYTRAKEFYDGPGSCGYAREVVKQFESPFHGQASITLRKSESLEELEDETLGDMPLGLVICGKGLDMIEMSRLSTDVVQERLNIVHSAILFEREYVEVGLRVFQKIWHKVLQRKNLENI